MADIFFKHWFTGDSCLGIKFKSISRDMKVYVFGGWGWGGGWKSRSAQQAKNVASCFPSEAIAPLFATRDKITGFLNIHCHCDEIVYRANSAIVADPQSQGLWKLYRPNSAIAADPQCLGLCKLYRPNSVIAANSQCLGL